MTGKLEAHFDEADDDTMPTDSIQAAEVISRLDSILNSENFESKSDITQRNLRGLVRGKVVNAYLFNTYGFRIEPLDELILHKTLWVTSIGGKGRQEVKNIVEAVKAVIEARGGVDLSDRMLGIGTQRR